jgi:alpha-amylase
LERDTSCWLGNALQQAGFIYQKRLEAPVKESRNLPLLQIWRTLLLSDHLYYIFTHGGAPGEVHSYFSPYGLPYDASVTYFSVLCDLHYRLKKKIHLADSPFRFATGVDQFTGEVAWSLAGLQNILETVSIESLQYHSSQGDLALWAKTSLADAPLAQQLARSEILTGEELRKSLITAVKVALKEDK